ncbi:MAG: type II toxin-antitoxin system RelE/ParE family toxin [Propionivibrio sp.]
MTRLVWRPMAFADRDTIMDYIAQDNPAAAVELDDDFEIKAEDARHRPTLYRTGRVQGTREIVVRPNYIMVYRIEDEGGTVAVLRVLHAAQQSPPAS